MSFNVQSFLCTYNTATYIHGAIPLVFLSPCWFPCAPPFVSPFTYLAPSSCDRNRPPTSQVACKLTPFAPPFTQLSHPFQIPRTPTAKRLTKTTSGIFRLLLSGTLISYALVDLSWAPQQPICRQHVLYCRERKNHPQPILWNLGFDKNWFVVNGSCSAVNIALRLHFSLRSDCHAEVECTGQNITWQVIDSGRIGFLFYHLAIPSWSPSTSRSIPPNKIYLKKQGTFWLAYLVTGNTLLHLLSQHRITEFVKHLHCPLILGS
jgi:hypothetical protein